MRGTLTLRLVASFLLLSSPVLADAPSYKVTKEKSFLKFIAIQNGAPVEGRFSDYDTDIRFDPEHPELSHIMVEVATGSETSDNEDVTKNLKLPEWLSVEKFPKAVFKSTKISRMPKSDNYYADGTLTLRDNPLPVVLNFQIEHFDGKGAIAKGYVTLRRSDFGVGEGQWSRDDVIKNEVRVEFRIVATKQ